jgi:hypothetical protein
VQRSNGHSRHSYGRGIGSSPEYGLLATSMARLWNPREVIQREALPLTGARSDYDDLLELVADVQYVMLGEASHGTHEALTQHLRRRTSRPKDCRVGAQLASR